MTDALRDQTKNWMYSLFAWDQAKRADMVRALAAKGMGIDPTLAGQFPGTSTINIISGMEPSAPPPMPPTWNPVPATAPTSVTVPAATDNKTVPLANGVLKGAGIALVATALGAGGIGLLSSWMRPSPVAPAPAAPLVQQPAAIPPPQDYDIGFKVIDGKLQLSQPVPVKP